MTDVGWFLLAGAVFLVYGAVILATLTGAIRAIHDRDLPPWIVGLGVTVGVMFLLAGLNEPLGPWGFVLAVVLGMVAAGLYGLRRRRRVTATMGS